ncbi:MAG: hypothetical protein V7637_2750, partial [Mycobacteriales bacterium]
GSARRSPSPRSHPTSRPRARRGSRGAGPAPLRSTPPARGTARSLGRIAGRCAAPVRLGSPSDRPPVLVSATSRLPVRGGSFAHTTWCCCVLRAGLRASTAGSDRPLAVVRSAGRGAGGWSRLDCAAARGRVLCRSTAGRRCVPVGLTARFGSGSSVGVGLGGPAWLARGGGPAVQPRARPGSMVGGPAVRRVGVVPARSGTSGSGADCLDVGRRPRGLAWLVQWCGLAGVRVGRAVGSAGTGRAWREYD